MKKAFITGITGQDGSYLAEFLLKKNYQVIGLISQTYDFGKQNIMAIKKDLILESGDLLDEKSLYRIIKKYLPKEIYNLGGISFVPTSWKKPELTFQVNSLGVLKILQIIKDILPKTKFYQATSAKIFGNPTMGPQTEKTPIQPDSPYGTSKACAHFLTQHYRSHYNLFCCSGIMYNHESERRGFNFVTRKITSTAAKIKLGKAKKLYLGDLEAKGDWGYAPDYVEAMWLMLQQRTPADYIIASGSLHSLKEICQIAFAFLGLDWRQYTEQKKELIRKESACCFYGNPDRALKKLQWRPKVDFKTMIEKMTLHDFNLVKKGEL